MAGDTLGTLRGFLDEVVRAAAGSSHTAPLLLEGGQLRPFEIARIFVAHATDHGALAAVAASFQDWLWRDAQHRLVSADPTNLRLAFAPDVALDFGALLRALASDRAASGRVWAAIAVACGTHVPPSAEAARGLLQRIGQPQPPQAPVTTAAAIGQLFAQTSGAGGAPPSADAALSSVDGMMAGVDAGTCDLPVLLETAAAFAEPVLETARTEEERRQIEANSRALVDDFMREVLPIAQQARQQAVASGVGPRQATFNLTRDNGTSARFLQRMMEGARDRTTDIGFVLRLVAQKAAATQHAPSSPGLD